MPSRKYATEEERNAAVAAQRKAKRARQRAERAHLAPEGDLRRKYATAQEQAEARQRNTLKANRKRKQREKAARRAAREETQAAAQRFRRVVPALLNSAIRTRLFIALCERGPYTVKDAGLTLASSSQPARHAAIQFLVSLGIAARHHPTKTAFPVYYLNPGHPAYHELLRLGRRLAERWPSPPRPVRNVPQPPVALPAPVPCTLFRATEGPNRALLMIAVSGAITASDLYHRGGVFSGSRAVADSLEFFIAAGMVLREQRPYGKGVGRGQARRYRLDPEFFAHEELRDVLWALAATVHDDIAGHAVALARKHPEMRDSLAAFERATAHLRTMSTAL